MVTTDNFTEQYSTARNLYLSWVDASVHANERFVRVARVWLDETLGAQQDFASLIKRAVDETPLATAEESATPFSFFNRASDLARTNYQIWTEAGLKTQERAARIVQTAFEELRGAQTEIAQRTEEGIGDLRARKNGK